MMREKGAGIERATEPTYPEILMQQAFAAFERKEYALACESIQKIPKGHPVLNMLWPSAETLEGDKKTQRTLLHKAAKDKNGIKLLTDLLAQGANACALDSKGRTPLLMAALANNDAAIRPLLQNTARTNAINLPLPSRKSTPLNIFSSKNNPRAVRVLLELGADARVMNDGGRTPLHWAAFNGDADSIRRLLNAGAIKNAKDLSGKTPCDLARDNGQAAVLNMLMTSEDFIRAAKEAVAVGNTEAALTAIRDIPDGDAALNKLFDENRETLMHQVVKNKKMLPVLELLLQKKASPIIRDAKGYAPLHTAFLENALFIQEVVLLFKKSDLDLNIESAAGETLWDINEREFESMKDIFEVFLWNEGIVPGRKNRKLPAKKKSAQLIDNEGFPLLDNDGFRLLDHAFMENLHAPKPLEWAARRLGAIVRIKDGYEFQPVAVVQPVVERSDSPTFSAHLVSHMPVTEQSESGNLSDSVTQLSDMPNKDVVQPVAAVQQAFARSDSSTGSVHTMNAVQSTPIINQIGQGVVLALGSVLLSALSLIVYPLSGIMEMFLESTALEDWCNTSWERLSTAWMQIGQSATVLDLSQSMPAARVAVETMHSGQIEDAVSTATASAQTGLHPINGIKP